jgi:hypothetical protein
MHPCEAGWPGKLPMWRPKSLQDSRKKKGIVGSIAQIKGEVSLQISCAA